jgi:hypothetical protein
MALPAIALQVVSNILRELNKSPASGRRILSLGYPDILVPPETIAQFFGSEIAGKIQFHSDSESIARWHNISQMTSRIVESKHFFSLLGYELDIVDIVKARGDEIVLNLNEPCPNDMHARYALVMDGGTIEHCFNIGQAMKNLASMVAKGGYIYQSNPLNSFNHGFFNLNPTFYFDFYQKNGFVVELFKVVSNPHNPQIFDVPPFDRFKGPPEGSANLLVVRREEIVDLIYPIQTKYVKNPLLKG